MRLAILSNDETEAADRIVVLDDGVIAEAGSHDQLMALGGARDGNPRDILSRGHYPGATWLCS